MKNTNRVRIAGVVGGFGALPWLIALFVEYGFGLQPPGSGALYQVNQEMFSIATLCYMIAIFGLMWARAAGDGRFGKMALGIFVLGWTLLLVAQGVSLIAGNLDLEVLLPIGGLTSALGGLIAGIAVVTARRWHGWQRFAPLIQGLYASLLVILAIVADQEPNLLTGSVWTVTWFLIGLALYTSESATERTAVAE